ncbi:hypothetical protein F4778DRAFT_781340 [Xylariomycetidae sp. FL2044]|nr:hypothetical protein F4778DRAFT_781340 [Xylariomycetidae sp. FL2044]
MGFWDSWDGGSVISRKPSHHHHKKSSSSHKHRKRSKSRSRSRSRVRHSYTAPSGLGGLFGADSHYQKHNASRGSFFNLGNSSTRSFFGLGRSNSSSFYKRSPRANFVQRMYKKLKRLLRDLMHYAKRHPVKVFMLVIMPLITGGALTALLARFGLRLPPGLERLLGIAARTASGDGIGLVGEAMRMVGGGGGGGGGGGSGSVRVERGRDGAGYQWERRSEYSSDGFGGGGGDWGNGFLGGIGRIFS